VISLEEEISEELEDNGEEYYSSDDYSWLDEDLNIDIEPLEVEIAEVSKSGDVYLKFN
jgi:hypothetical protein